MSSSEESDAVLFHNDLENLLEVEIDSFDDSINDSMDIVESNKGKKLDFLNSLKN